MDRITEVFKAYEQNIKYKIQMNGEILEFKTEDDWKKKRDMMLDRRLFAIKMSDNTLCALEEILAMPLTEESAELLFTLSKKIYQEEDEDYLWLMKVMDVLLPFYEEKRDEQKLLWLYSMHFYLHNYVKARKLVLHQVDFTYADCVLSRLDKYTAFEKVEDRFRFWVTFHNKICIGLNENCFSTEEIFDTVRLFREFWESPEVQSIDGDNETIASVVLNIRIKVIATLFQIERENSQISERFIRGVMEIYERERKLVKSEYELEPILYAGYLYTTYMQKKNSIDDIFESYLNFYQYRYIKYMEEETPSMETLAFYDDSIEIFSNWAPRVQNPEKIRRMVSIYMNLAQHRWKKLSEEMVTNLNLTIKRLCIELVKYGDMVINAEQCIVKMIINRDMMLNLHSHNVEKLAVKIADKAYDSNPELFAQYAGMGKGFLLRKISMSALFHDIGKVDLREAIYADLRRRTKEEEEAIKKHVNIGADYISQMEELKQYREVILYHHLDYDHKHGYPMISEDVVIEDQILVDLIHIADFIADHITQFFYLGKTLDFEQILKKMEEGRNTRFHPAFVDLILSDYDIKDEIARLLADSHFDQVYEYMNNMEGVVIELDFESAAREVRRKIPELIRKKEYEELERNLNKLFELAIEDPTNINLGIAYYTALLAYYQKRDYLQSINSALEVIHYLDGTDYYEYLARTYNCLGILMLYQGNFENSMGYFLKCIEYSKMFKGSESSLGSAYNNLGNLFKDHMNYDRALYYFKESQVYLQDNLNYMATIWCNMIYCYYMLDDKENVIACKEEIEKIRKEKEVNGFDIYVHMALANFYLKDFRTMDLELRRANEMIQSVREYITDIQEIHIYLDLLEKLGRTEELVEVLERLIAYCDNHTVNSELVNNLLQRRMKCGYMMNDSKNISYYAACISANEEKNQMKRAEIALQMEKAYKENLHMQRKQHDVIQKKKKLEQEVLEAQQANAAKADFLISMSHEIRTPIHAVLGLDEMILRESKEENIIQYATDIQNAGKTLIGIINDVLDISKMESGEMDINPENYQIVSVITDLKNMIESRAKDKNLKFFIHCDADLPKTLHGDSLRIKQVILNVLTNAVKYTREGQIDFTIQSRKKDAEHIWLEVRVKDTGIGMKPEDLEKLTKPFVRIDEKQNRNIEGTGLGMSIVNNLIKQMEGTMKVDSEYQKGSEFTILIPQIVVDWNGVGEHCFDKKTAVNGRKEALFTAPNAKVLLVDDNAVNLKVVSSLLKRTKVQVTAVKSGKECLNLAEKEKYDLIFLDHRMPELDGIETLNLLREMCIPNLKTPVIALTANAVNGAADFYKEKGFDELVIKPVDYVEMERKMMNLLSESLIHRSSS